MKPYLETKDFSVSQERFKLLYDENLEMLVTKPQPENLDKYYQSEAYQKQKKHFLMLEQVQVIF